MNQKIKSLLKSLEKTREIFWNITPETGKFLNLLIKDRKFKTILEIGTSNGYSGIWLAEGAKHNDGHLYTIESHKERFSLAEKIFKKSGLSEFITQIKGHAPEAIPKFKKKIDMAFFDATKYEHPDYFKAIEKHIKKGGFIITDNVASHITEFVPFLELLKKSPNWKSYPLNIGSGLMISIKN